MFSRRWKQKPTVTGNRFETDSGDGRPPHEEDRRTVVSLSKPSRAVQNVSETLRHDRRESSSGGWVVAGARTRKPPATTKTVRSPRQQNRATWSIQISRWKKVQNKTDRSTPPSPLPAEPRATFVETRARARGAPKCREATEFREKLARSVFARARRTVSPLQLARPKMSAVHLLVVGHFVVGSCRRLRSRSAGTRVRGADCGKRAFSVNRRGRQNGRADAEKKPTWARREGARDSLGFTSVFALFWESDATIDATAVGGSAPVEK